MNLKKSIGSLMLGATGLLGSCISPNLENQINEPRAYQRTNTQITQEETKAREYTPMQQAMEELGIRNHMFLDRDLPEGYFAHRRTGAKIDALTGIRTGDLEIIETDKGYAIKGNFSRYNSREELLEILSIVDTNGDKIVTEPEVNRIYREIGLN